MLFTGRAVIAKINVNIGLLPHKEINVENAYFLKTWPLDY
jgi:hypothetical protein